jgi:hypothetical protein
VREDFPARISRNKRLTICNKLWLNYSYPDKYLVKEKNMKKFGKIAVLILVVAMLLVACGDKDEAPATVAAEPAPIVVDTTAFEKAVADLADSVSALEAKVDALAVEDKTMTEVTPIADGEVAVDDNGFLITTYVDKEGRTLTCGLASVINTGAPIYQIAVDKNGELRYNSVGNPILQPAPHLFLDEEYVCVESPPIRVDGGSAFRLQYAQYDEVLGEWRGLGGDWYSCCFVNFEDVARETYGPQ